MDQCKIKDLIYILDSKTPVEIIGRKTGEIICSIDSIRDIPYIHAMCEVKSIRSSIKIGDTNIPIFQIIV